MAWFFKLNSPDHIRPICLPINEHIRSLDFVDKTPFAGSVKFYTFNLGKKIITFYLQRINYCFLAGWGFSRENGELSPILMQVQVPVIANADCRKMYRKIGDDATAIQFSERVMCAGIREGEGTCTGDSGTLSTLPA